jgi:methylmalonyl-CoA/ethylmalonyl-CoA epimerase
MVERGGLERVGLERVEHVALAVADLDVALRHYDEVWGLRAARRELVEDQHVEEAMLGIGDSWLQLISPTDATSTVARWLSKRGEGLHHIAYEVTNVNETLRLLEAKGVELIDDRPRRGGGGSLVAFVSPRGNHGVLVELVERASGDTRPW